MIVRAGEANDNPHDPTLSLPAVMGNLFIFMFAGHEANANTILFAMLLLACHPPMQRLLQQDIDNTLSHSMSSPQDWSYAKLYPIFATNMVGAVVNETLRVASVLPFLPKTTTGSSPQAVAISGRIHIIPAHTLILINTSATHQHPKHWPQAPSSLVSAGMSNPVASFNPQYWLGPRATDPKGLDQPDGFLRPSPGSFVPFSDGGRGCLGKKFALVELYALIVRIFSEYSVELVAGEGKQISSRAGLKEEWVKAKANAESQLIDGVEFDMSLRFKGALPITFVRRGQEKYAEIIDI